MGGLLPLSLEMVGTSVSQMEAGNPPVGGCLARPAITGSNIGLLVKAGGAIGELILLILLAGTVVRVRYVAP